VIDRPHAPVLRDQRVGLIEVVVANQLAKEALARLRRSPAMASVMTVRKAKMKNLL